MKKYSIAIALTYIYINIYIITSNICSYMFMVLFALKPSEAIVHDPTNPQHSKMLHLGTPTAQSVRGFAGLKLGTLGKNCRETRWFFLSTIGGFLGFINIYKPIN